MEWLLLEIILFYSNIVCVIIFLFLKSVVGFNDRYETKSLDDDFLYSNRGNVRLFNLVGSFFMVTIISLIYDTYSEYAPVTVYNSMLAYTIFLTIFFALILLDYFFSCNVSSRAYVLSGLVYVIGSLITLPIILYRCKTSGVDFSSSPSMIRYSALISLSTIAFPFALLIVGVLIAFIVKRIKECRKKSE